jgi:hypothetical protein
MNDTPLEGHDSAENIQREAVSPEEILRIRRARAVAKRSIMSDLAHWCDQKARNIETTNQGRKRGSVTTIGKWDAQVAKDIGDYIWAERDKIEVPTCNKKE